MNPDRRFHNLFQGACFGDNSNRNLARPCVDKVIPFLNVTIAHLQMIANGTLALSDVRRSLDACKMAPCSQGCRNQVQAVINRAGCCGASIPSVIGLLGHTAATNSSCFLKGLILPQPCWAGRNVTVRASVLTNVSAQATCDELVEDAAVGAQIGRDQVTCTPRSGNRRRLLAQTVTADITMTNVQTDSVSISGTGSALSGTLQSVQVLSAGVSTTTTMAPAAPTPAPTPAPTVSPASAMDYTIAIAILLATIVFFVL